MNEHAEKKARLSKWQNKIYGLKSKEYRKKKNRRRKKCITALSKRTKELTNRLTNFSLKVGIHFNAKNGERKKCAFLLQQIEVKENSVNSFGIHLNSTARIHMICT